MTTDRVAAIRGRLEGATPGPWELTPIYSDGSGNRLVRRWRVADRRGRDGTTEREEWVSADLDTSDADTELIAHAPDDLAYLLAENEKLRDKIDVLGLKVRERTGQIRKLTAAADSSRPSGELTREQVENWIANVGAPGPVLAFNEGAARRLGESWLRLHDRLAEIERAPRPSGEVPEAAVWFETLEQTAWALGWALQFVTDRDRKDSTIEQIYNHAQAAHSRAWAQLIAAGWTPPGGTE